MTDKWYGITWDAMSPERREAIIRRARWITGKKTLNHVGRRLLRSSWADISDGTQDILIRHGVDIFDILTNARRETRVVAGLAPS